MDRRGEVLTEVESAAIYIPGLGGVLGLAAARRPACGGQAVLGRTEVLNPCCGEGWAGRHEHDGMVTSMTDAQTVRGDPRGP